MKTAFKLTLTASACALLAACGGGGGGGGGTAVSESETNPASGYAIVSPTKITAMPLTGSASYPAEVTDYGTGTISFATSSATSIVSTSNATYNAATSTKFQVYPTVHLTTEIVNSWRNGWTGAGVTISVIDDFVNSSGVVTNTSPVITRTANYDDAFWGTVQGTYDLIYEWKTSFSHGQSVSNIAGGDSDGRQVTASGPVVATSVIKKSCATIVSGPSGFIRDFCEPQFYKTFSSFEESMTLTYKKVAGVAKQALVIENNVNLSAKQNPIQTVADIQGHLKNSSYLGVINLSLGSDIPTSGKTFDQVMSEVAKFPIAKVDAVITVAAGNGGKACATEDLNGCNTVAVAMSYQPSTAASTIIVGATSGAGSSENIATYSTRAGILAQRFILASGEEGDANVIGTSYAAPRVAGVAAILKQKFPTLTSAQIANVILLSASKDINNDGADDFTGVSPIYGHGKLSLTRALALAGAI